MRNLSQYNEIFISKLNEQLAVYTTIGTPRVESPMWFQYKELKEGSLYFQSSQNGYMYFNIPLNNSLDSLHSDYIRVSFTEVYDHFRQVKYDHIKDNWPTVYYELRPNEKPQPKKQKTIEVKEFIQPESTDYNKQAIDFLKDTATTFAATYKTHDFYFDGDKQTRDIYTIVLKNKLHRYRFTFGQSIAKSNVPPSVYDVLACLTKYDIGNFENFCSDFGYNTDSRTAYKTYKAVLKEWKNIERLFTNDQLELLQEIN
tara:strand:- start:1031 stop:1801 length:771 start_codon:yes stop_codon:yes gene_type:complete